MPETRKERGLGRNIHTQKKLMRLVFSKKLTKYDFYRINQIYEQKQYENFWYALIIPGILSVGVSSIIKKYFAFGYLFGGLALANTYFLFHWRINYHFECQMLPYFEKYHVK